MQHYKKHHQLIATFFLLIIFPTFIPLDLFANNNGPTAPEANSFEPVDAADMVNLVSGDMSYVLPLLTVPSPEGGYPLALSNHAGIAMDQEASWVGLGWSLNPGAINRSVTGVPDDWKRANVNQIVYNEGGSITSYNGSVSVGWGNHGASVGLYGSYTENKTFGGTTSYNTDGGVIGSLSGFSASIGTDGASIGISSQNKIGQASLGVNQSFKNGSTGISIGVNGKTPMDKNNRPDYLGIGGGIGISLNSKSGLSGSVVGQGFSLSGNKNSNGNLTISTSSFNIPIQIYAVNVSLGYSRTRYWTYENTYTGYEGSLYSGDMDGFEQSTNFGSMNATDSYNSLYIENIENQAKEDNLSFMAYDYYSVSGQGISGSFKPGIFENGSLINNSKIASGNDPSSISYKTGNYSRLTKTIDNNFNDIHFYFENEPSSYLKLSSTGWAFSPIAPGNPPENYTPSSSFNSLSFIDGIAKSGYNASIKRKRTSSFIETFTNKEINTSNSIILNPENYDRTSAPADGIGAFKITVLDGKVYHYSLPVYQKEQFTKGADVNSDFNSRFFERQQSTAYATHWLLTAVTGPDYIDINFNNKVDQEDFGYWTSFDYGKWSDGYTWLSPIKSDGVNKSYSWGVKELYYLDKIKTRTHTALFIKEERLDDLSYSFQNGNNENDLEWKNSRNRNLRRGKDGIWYYDGIYKNNIIPTFPQPYWIMKAKWGRYIKCNQHKSLKLSKILLLKNNDVSVEKNAGVNRTSNFKGQIKFKENYEEVYIFNPYLTNVYDADGINKTWNGEYFNNVYDKKDIEGKGLEQKAIKSIVFDYSQDNNILAKNAPNSEELYSGRLTLNSVRFIGKNNQQSIPAYKFGYVNNANYDASKEDNWGYFKDNPALWSLNKIVTPVGSEISITYESDDFDKEAVALSTTALTPSDKNSGGSRVKEVSVKESSVIKSTIKYSYNVTGFGENKMDSNYKSSGITSYLPSKSFKEVKYLSELPSPGVMYEYVTVKNYGSNNQLEAVQEYHFNVLKQDISTVSTSLKIQDILEIEKTQSSPWSGSSNGENYNMSFSKYDIKDMTSALGRLKYIKTFNGSRQLLSKTENIFQSISDIKQGISEETFSTYKKVNDGTNLTYRLGSTSKIKYPSILQSTTSTQGGYVVSTLADKIDFLTGQVLETSSISSDGKTFKTKTVPAYLKYPEMGSKVDDINNKNMLSQTAASYSYILDKPTNTWKETGVGISTWSNLWTYKDIGGDSSTPTASKEKIWRQHKSYIWNGSKDTDGIFTGYNNTNDDGFVWGVGLPQTSIKWKQASEVTLYDHFSMPLEMKDINGNFASTKMGDNETKVTATGNAGYNEMFFTSAETIMHNYWLDPEVRMVSATRSTAFAHTGANSVATTSSSELGVVFRGNQHKPGKYKLSVWVKKDNESKARVRYWDNAITTTTIFNGERVAAGDWVQLTHYFDLPTDQRFVYVNSSDGTTVYYDDLMIRPIASSISGYVYNSYDELTYIVGNNGLATKFEYDAAGRLIKTYVEVVDDTANGLTGGFKLSSENKINYKNL